MDIKEIEVCPSMFYELRFDTARLYLLPGLLPESGWNNYREPFHGCGTASRFHVDIISMRRSDPQLFSMCGRRYQVQMTIMFVTLFPVNETEKVDFKSSATILPLIQYGSTPNKHACHFNSLSLFPVEESIAVGHKT